jgi:nicotinamide riboside kinase
MRVSFFAGPGAGKSAIAAKVYGDLKARGQSVELIPEYIKKWAYLGRVPKSFDQVYVFGKQLQSEDVLFQSGVKNIITDSPMLMQCAYAKKYEFPAWESLLNISNEFDKKYSQCNVFLDRTGIPYESVGRYETYEQAVEMDEKIKQVLKDNNQKYTTIRTLDYNEILEYVFSQLDS